jgi:hypothetical protein
MTMLMGEQGNDSRHLMFFVRTVLYPPLIVLGYKLSLITRHGGEQDNVKKALSEVLWFSMCLY